MKKALVPLAILSFGLAACCHTYDLEVQGHQLTQVRTWDLIGPSTVGFYESVDGKLHVYQDSSGNILGQVAQGVGMGYAGERVGDGLKHQEADKTNISNDLSSSSNSHGGAALAAGGTGGSATAGAISGSTSGAVANSRSNSSALSNSRSNSTAGAASINMSKPHRK